MVTHAAILKITPAQLAALLTVSLQITGVQSDPITHTIEIRFDDPRLPEVIKGATPPEIDLQDLTRIATRGELSMRL